MRDYTTGRVFDYRRKKRVEHAEIPVSTAMANSDINWARNREELCNAAEVAEDRYNSRVARE